MNPERTPMILHATERLDGWTAARARAGRMLLALDFDGTLAPIVPVPDDAVLLPAVRGPLAALARRPDTRVAIVSGRGLDDVRRRVGLHAVHYAGNHGLEIDGPGVRRIHEEAARARPALEKCTVRLADLARDFAGVLVEDKGLTLSVHYRMVADPAAGPEVVARVHAACDGIDGLRLTDGKKVVEIRPDVEWDKGRATDFLIGELLPDAGPVVFIGDDRTDEDAFRAIGDRGEGVIVAAEPPPDTAARSFVRSPDEVAALLDALARS